MAEEPVMVDTTPPKVSAVTGPSVALKYDDNKNPLELLPWEALEQVGLVLQHGARKYGSHNWRKGLAWTRLYGACLRHLSKWAQGEDIDKESGLSHLAHATCCLLFLLSKVGTDDRYSSECTQTRR